MSPPAHQSHSSPKSLQFLECLWSFSTTHQPVPVLTPKCMGLYSRMLTYWAKNVADRLVALSIFRYPGLLYQRSMICFHLKLLACQKIVRLIRCPTSGQCLFFILGIPHFRWRQGSGDTMQPVTGSSLQAVLARPLAHMTSHRLVAWLDCQAHTALILQLWVSSL